jgi:FkbM family methyltransferase
MLIDDFINAIKINNKNFTPEIILDIGSRDLDQSIEFNSTYPNAKIYSFEPNPSQYEICFNKSKNYSNITTIKKAVSNVNGTLDFYVTEGNIGCSSLLEPIYVPYGLTQNFKKITVESIKLEPWLRENKINKVDIIWIDIQGIDLDALKSMGEYIKSVKYIHCEASELGYYKGHQLKNELESFLTQNNFSLRFIPAPNHPFKEGDIIAINMDM